MDDETRKSIVDTNLLMEIMEKQELLEDNPSLQILQRMDRDNHEALNLLFKEIGTVLDEQRFEDAANLLIKVQYLIRLQEQLKERLPAT